MLKLNIKYFKVTLGTILGLMIQQTVHAEPNTDIQNNEEQVTFDKYYDVYNFERQRAARDLYLEKNQKLTEEFTGHTLKKGQHQIGTQYDYGITDHFSIGTDIVATMLGPNINFKGRVFSTQKHEVSLGLVYSKMTLDTIYFRDIKSLFTELEGETTRTAVSWSFHASKRLVLHTYWSIGSGNISAELSENGRKSLWESKYPGIAYQKSSTDDTEDDDSENSEEINQEKRSNEAETSFAQRSFIIQSLAGFHTDKFQVTGEIRQQNHNKILLTCRIEGQEFEEIKGNSLRVTVAQHWVWPDFRLRIGGGAQYSHISGTDLDGEDIDETGFQPVSELSFYWLLPR